MAFAGKPTERTVAKVIFQLLCFSFRQTSPVAERSRPISASHDCAAAMSYTSGLKSIARWTKNQNAIPEMESLPKENEDRRGYRDGSWPNG